MNKPTITALRRKSSKTNTIEKLIAFDATDSTKATITMTISEETEIEPTIYASGAVKSPSVNLGQRATIPSTRRKRARSHDTKLFSVNDDGSGSDITEEDEQQHANVSYYASGAISTHTNKPKIRNYRRAKSHNIIQDDAEYNYDSIWMVKSNGLVHDENQVIDAVMDKPCVQNKRKHKSHKLDMKSLIPQ